MGKILGRPKGTLGKSKLDGKTDRRFLFRYYGNPYRRMLKAGFSQFGQALFTVSSGIEGLQMFLETRVALVICDIGMPELNGWEVGKRIKEMCREKEIQKTPFILVINPAATAYPKTTKPLRRCRGFAVRRTSRLHRQIIPLGVL